jgi:hypothetical protein
MSINQEGDSNWEDWEGDSEKSRVAWPVRVRTDLTGKSTMETRLHRPSQANLS